LRYQKYNVCGTGMFTDHHVYTQKDVDLIVRAAKEAGAELLLTTAKDAVKLSNLKFEVPCFVVEIASTIDAADDFAAML